MTLYRLLGGQQLETLLGEITRQLGTVAWSALGSSLWDELCPTHERIMRHVTVLTTDIVGFSELVVRLGDVAAHLVIRKHNRMLRACLREFRGREAAHTGDGIIAWFENTDDAISCALRIQELFKKTREMAEVTSPVHVRVGLHAGRTLPEEGRLFGSAVIVAVRVCGVTPADAVLVSRPVREAARLGRHFEDRGLFRLKGFHEPQQLFAVAAT